MLLLIFFHKMVAALHLGHTTRVQNYKENLKGQRKREKNLRFAPYIVNLLQ